MVRLSDMKDLGSVVGMLSGLNDQFLATAPGYKVITCTVSKGVSEGSITFTWNPGTEDYDVTITPGANTAPINPP